MDRPKLRNLDRFRLDRPGQRLVVLRDPLGIADALAIDEALTPVLDLLDGRHTPAQVRQSLLLAGRLDIATEDVGRLAADLDQAGLLEGTGFERRFQGVHEAFLAADVREPALAGVLYPGDPGELAGHLAHHRVAAPTAPGSPVGLVVAPHSPLEIAGPLASVALTGLPPADEIDTVVVLGTDHGPGLLPFAATAKDFATPLHRTACDLALLDALERRVPWILREEIRHRSAISIEWAVLLLQAVYSASCPPILPILCGKTALSRSDETESLIACLEGLLEGRRVLVWVSAELGHGGAAYGKPELGVDGRVRLAERDRRCVDALTRGDARGLVRACADDPELGRPSGAAALATALELVPDRTPIAVDYRTLDAPGEVAGVLGLVGARFGR